MKKKPPFSLAQTFEAIGEVDSKGVSNIDIVFSDEFAPSYSIAKAERPETSVTKRTRPSFYNDHVIETLELALKMAFDIGAPEIPYAFPLQFNFISREQSNAALSCVGDLVENEKEGSPNWLALVCYLNWVLACSNHSEGAPANITAERMFIAGATARELELVLLNRDNAVRGRKTKNAAKSGGEQRRGKFEPRTTEILLEMKRLLTQVTSVSRAAELSARRGFGTSQKANRALWYRHNKRKL